MGGAGAQASPTEANRQNGRDREKERVGEREVERKRREIGGYKRRWGMSSPVFNHRSVMSHRRGGGASSWVAVAASGNRLW